MPQLRTAFASIAFGAATLLAAGAHAATNAELAYHPALAKARPTAVALDAATFIPGHPARGATGAAPTTAAVVAGTPAQKPATRVAARAVTAAR